MQGRPHLLFAELIERIGFIAAELLAQLGEQRFCFLSLAQSHIGSSKQIGRIARVSLRIWIEVACNLQVNERVLWAARFEQCRSTEYSGRNGVWVECDRLIEFR